MAAVPLIGALLMGMVHLFQEQRGDYGDDDPIHLAAFVLVYSGFLLMGVYALRQQDRETAQLIDELFIIAKNDLGMSLSP